MGVIWARATRAAWTDDGATEGTSGPPAEVNRERAATAAASMHTLAELHSAVAQPCGLVRRELKANSRRPNAGENVRHAT